MLQSETGKKAPLSGCYWRERSLNTGIGLQASHLPVQTSFQICLLWAATGSREWTETSVNPSCCVLLGVRTKQLPFSSESAGPPRTFVQRERESERVSLVIFVCCVRCSIELYYHCWLLHVFLPYKAFACLLKPI